jgi:hypothetical protein
MGFLDPLPKNDKLLLDLRNLSFFAILSNRSPRTGFDFVETFVESFQLYLDDRFNLFPSFFVFKKLSKFGDHIRMANEFGTLP